MSYDSLTIICIIEIVQGKNSEVIGPPISYIVHCVLGYTLPPNSTVVGKTYNKNRDKIITGDYCNK